MRKSIILLFLVLTLALAQSCTKPEAQTNAQPYIGGTRALSILFAEGAPPLEVFDARTYPFDVEVKLQNVGESDIAAQNVKIQLSGINPVDFGRSQSDFIKDGISEPILATKIDSEGNKIEGPPVFVTFSGLMYQDTLPGNNQFPVRADVCYTYQTNAFADGCVRADVLSTDKDAVCQIHEAKTVFNSGAPIQITEFTEQPSGSDKVRYVFKIKHLGTGRVFLPNTKCPSDVQTNRVSENRVFFRIESKVQDLACTGLRSGTGKEGEVFLINGEATIHCTQQTQSSLDFIDKLRITLTYDYKEFAAVDILVKKSIN